MEALCSLWSSSESHKIWANYSWPQLPCAMIYFWRRFRRREGRKELRMRYGSLSVGFRRDICGNEWRWVIFVGNTSIIWVFMMDESSVIDVISPRHVSISKITSSEGQICFLFWDHIQCNFVILLILSKLLSWFCDSFNKKQATLWLHWCWWIETVQVDNYRKLPKKVFVALTSY